MSLDQPVPDSVRRRRSRRVRFAAAVLTASGMVGGLAVMAPAGQALSLPIINPTTTTAKSSSTTAATNTAPKVVVTNNCYCAAGVKVINATVRSAAGDGRFWITVNDKRVAEYGVSTTSKSVAVRAYVPDNGTIGVTSVAPYGGQTRTLTVSSFTLGPAPDDSYTVAGRSMVDASGNVFRSFGVNISGFEYFRYGSMTGDANAAGARSWGANIVRVLVSEHFWDPSSCYYDPDYAARVENEVAVLNGRGMYVLLNQWGSMAGDTCGVVKNRGMADDMAISFWKSAANVFKDNAHVAFDLYNEPHNVSYGVWRNGGTVENFHTPGMQAMYDAVRSQGASNLVFVSGPSWANDLRVTSQAPIDGYGIVYAAHAYCFNCGKPLPGSLNDWVAPSTYSYPVVITEFGDIDNDQGAYNQRVIDWAGQKGVGWIAYSWSRANNGNPWALITDMEGFYKPTPNGKPVYNALQYVKSVS